MKIINRREFFRGTLILIVVSLILMVFGIGNTLADWVIEPTKAGFVPVKGGRIWYRMNGNEHFAKGKTPLIVIHGGPGFSHHYLLPLVDLADERPVILYDQLDSGF